MKRIFALFASMILTALPLTACGASTQGPTTWIDQPLGGAQVPLATLTIQAHASDADGIGSIEFYVSESLIASIPAGGGRLGQASIDWMPPGPGTYTIIARAIDNQGNFGPQTEVQIVVGTANMTTGTTIPAPASAQCAAGDLVAPVLLSPSDSAIVTSEPVLAWSYPNNTCHPHSYRIDISEDASFSDIGRGFGTADYSETSREWPLPSGKCYYWRALAYVPDTNGPASPSWRFCVAEEVTGPSFTLTKNANCREGPGAAYDTDDTLFEEQTVLIEGRNEESSWLWVKKVSGSGHCWVSVITGQVLGDLSVVQIVSAAPLPIEPSAPGGGQPAADTTLPSISSLSADPTSFQAQGCGEPATTLVSAAVSDAGGISRVVARVLGMGEVEMSAVGGGVYQAVLGPFSDTGEYSILIQAWDNTGNNASAGPLTVTVVCIG